MEQLKKLLSELGEMIEMAHQHGNDHHEREEQYELFQKIESCLENLSSENIFDLLSRYKNSLLEINKSIQSQNESSSSLIFLKGKRDMLENIINDLNLILVN